MSATRRISLLLAAAMLTCAVAASCAEKADDTPEVTDISTVAEEQTETGETLKSNLPDGLSFDGASVRVINQPYFQRDIYTFNPSEETGDIVNDAVFARNRRVAEQLDVSFEMYDTYVVSGEDPIPFSRNSSPRTTTPTNSFTASSTASRSTLPTTSTPTFPLSPIST